MRRVDMKTIAIVGGGFAGIATLAQLIFQAQTPLKIFLIEHSSQLCKGVAYSTTSTLHPLNVRAKAMGALKQDPEDFLKWAQEKKKVDPNAFLSRQSYGQYLENLLHNALKESALKQIDVTILHKEAIDAELVPGSHVKLYFKEEYELECNYLVLATGAPPCKRLPFEIPELLENVRYTPNPWNPPSNSILKVEGFTDPSQKVLIIGAGLTMVDITTSLIEKNFQGDIYCISHHGIPSQAHDEIPRPITPFKAKHLPNTTRELFKKVRQLIKQHPWREVIDAFRSCSQDLWKSLPVDEQKCFLRHLLTYWNVHRHRMSPESAKLLKNLKERGKVFCFSGHVEEIKPMQKNGLQVRIKTAHGIQDMEFNHVIKCTGPEYRIKHQKNELLTNLYQKGLVQLDNLEMGLALSSEGFIKGAAPGKIYALGALLFGEKFETTAVPEIRDQAYEIAQKLLASVDD